MGGVKRPAGIFLLAGSVGAVGFWLSKQLSRKTKPEEEAASYVGTYGKDAPGIFIRFDLTPSQIEKETEKLIDTSQKVLDAIAAVSLEEVSYEKVIEPLARLESEESTKEQACEFPSMVSESKAVRDASTEAEKRLNAYNVKSSMREDVYRVVKAFAESKPELAAEEQRYVDRLVRDYERLGLNLDAATRAEVERIKTQIGEQCITYQRTLNEENTLLYFSSVELAGMPPDFLEGLKKGADGKLEVTLKYPHYFPIMKKCKVGATRRKLEFEFNCRCVEQNVPILEELVELRHKMAQLLGYSSHAHYVLAIRMAKDPNQVKEFLERISDKISPLAAKELESLKALKRDEEGAEEEFTMADLRYYMNKAEEINFKIDHEAVKEYFPLDVVTTGLMNIYQQLLGLQFAEVAKPHVWHADVSLFSVTDTETKELLGYFYLDLFPRDGKFGHACVCPLQSGCFLPDGSRQLAVAAMLANFTKPANGRPSLLQHTEVETYFHEFGHVMHNICSRASLARFAGTRVERDFVEAPSQMLENWCWEKPSLKLMSGHYKAVNDPIPDELSETLMSTKKAHAGLLCKRQLLFGLFDQIIHSQPSADTAAVLDELHPKVMMGIPNSSNTNFAGSFGHLAGGYDASYYGYMWSEVFSTDMFSTKFKSDVMSAAAGKQYRTMILQPGGSKDASDMLHEFLGRPPSEVPFLVSKGLEV